MNTTTKTQSDAVEATAIHLVPGDRLSVQLKSYFGGMDDYRSNFTVDSVAHYAERYKEDPQVAIARAEKFGHELYFVFAEATVISAHAQTPVKRVEVELGAIVELDGYLFKIAEAANHNLKLVPVATA